jgi:hypothetical protein
VVAVAARRPLFSGDQVSSSLREEEGRDAERGVRAPALFDRLVKHAAEQQFLGDGRDDQRHDALKDDQ